MTLKFSGAQHVFNNSQLVSVYPFTLTGWAKTTDNSVAQTILSLVDKDVDNIIFAMGFGSGGDFTITAQNTTEQTANAGSASNNTWYYFAAVFTNATTRELFINAISTVTDSNSVDYSSNVDRVAVGVTGRSTLTKYLTGDIAEISVWNRVLSQIEILYYKDRKLTGGELGLVGYWPMNDAGIGTSVAIKDLARGSDIIILNSGEVADWDNVNASTPDTVNTTDYIQGVACLDLGKTTGDIFSRYNFMGMGGANITNGFVNTQIYIEDKTEVSVGMYLFLYLPDYDNRLQIYSESANLFNGWHKYGGPSAWTSFGSPDLTDLQWLSVLFRTADADDTIAHGRLKMNRWELELDKGVNNGIMNGFAGNPWREGPPIILGRAA